MRFEAKTQLFESYVSAINNFINISKSLSMRHQLNMCYYMLSRDAFLSDSVGIDSVTEEMVATYYMKDVLLEAWPNFEKSFVNRTSSLTVNGTLYQLGSIISYRLLGILPQFEEVVDILSDSDFGVLFLLRLTETLCFEEHHHAFQVVSTEDNVTVKPTCLLDYHPMSKHHCGKDMELTVVCPKYDML
jgi:hypothetical protein